MQDIRGKLGLPIHLLVCENFVLLVLLYCVFLGFLTFIFLDKNFSRNFEILFLFFPENRL